MVVDFPAPFGPRKPKNCPGAMLKLTPSTAVKSPKLRVRPWQEIANVCAATNVSASGMSLLFILIAPNATGSVEVPPACQSFSLTLDNIAICDMIITDCDRIVTRKPMKLADKFRYLREVESSLRGLNRAMTQQELMRAIEAETGGRISQSYLSQIESGTRPHLTNTTRLLLARFFKVHPGYLVDDPEGYHAELLSDARALEDKLDLWLIGGAERFRRDPKLCKALLTLARHAESRDCLLLLESILETPSLAERLLQVLRPELNEQLPPSATAVNPTQPMFRRKSKSSPRRTSR